MTTRHDYTKKHGMGFVDAGIMVTTPPQTHNFLKSGIIATDGNATDSICCLLDARGLVWKLKYIAHS